MLRFVVRVSGISRDESAARALRGACSSELDLDRAGGKRRGVIIRPRKFRPVAAAVREYTTATTAGFAVAVVY
jgi:hypothetical protein